MITAIPMNDDRVANHFTKANCLVFLDERGVEINRVDNPALAANCAGKQKMVDLLAEQQVDRIVGRNIGEQMLGKLLARQFAVYHTNCGRRSATELVDPVASGLVQLEQANQGRQSLNHEAKKKSGGCSCHHPEGGEHSDACCHATEAPHEEMVPGRRCQMQGQGCGHRGQGHGRCCHS